MPQANEGQRGIVIVLIKALMTVATVDPQSEVQPRACFLSVPSRLRGVCSRLLSSQTIQVPPTTRKEASAR